MKSRYNVKWMLTLVDEYKLLFIVMLSQVMDESDKESFRVLCKTRISIIHFKLQLSLRELMRRMFLYVC